MFATSTVLLCYLRFQCSLFSDTTTATNIGNERHGPHLVETPEATCSVIWDHESLELEWLRWDETLKCDQEESYPFLDIPRSDVLMTGDREHSLTECQTSGLQTKQQSDSNQSKANCGEFPCLLCAARQPRWCRHCVHPQPPNPSALCTRCLLLY